VEAACEQLIDGAEIRIRIQPIQCLIAQIPQARGKLITEQVE
jgi:hypothetical protein